MENNKLLAEYLGLDTTIKDGKLFYILPDNNWVETKLWEPNANWNQLMPIVEKIEEDVENFNIVRCWAGIYIKVPRRDGEQPFEIDIIEAGQNNDLTKIQAIYNACVEYIKTIL